MNRDRWDVSTVLRRAAVESADRASPTTEEGGVLQDFVWKFLHTVHRDTRRFRRVFCPKVTTPTREAPCTAADANQVGRVAYCGRNIPR